MKQTKLKFRLSVPIRTLTVMSIILIGNRSADYGLQ